ncbi:MAG: GNAT family N-acetyltransferase [Deltaproteobacteria bacterium]|nr:GNAT family N-acetyltransferase [Deltaproteobacteria bacterium]
MPTRKSPKTRQWTEDDIPAIVACQVAAYPNFDNEYLCDERLYASQLAIFPEGQVLAEIDGVVVGYATSLIVQLDDDSPWYSYSEITGVGTFTTHTPSGDTLYGADIAVHPDYRRRGVAGALYRERKRIMRRYNLRRMVAGGRIPDYAKVAGQMTAEEYVDRVIRGELTDTSLSAHLAVGYKVKGLHLGYLNDAASLDYATLIEMENPRYNSAKRKIAAAPIRRPVRKVRVCAAQYEMRSIASWEEFERQVAFFVTTADEYHCHFLVFPELFTAQLFSSFPSEISTREAIERLADHTEDYIEMFRQMATQHQLFIIGGSHPVREGGLIYNTSHLFTPTGQVHLQDKLHITPGERRHWGVQPGRALQIFDTPMARIAIQVCYDIEFPEISRILALAGVEILFVPFSTDERKSYLRVRYSAQGCAVQNVLYVVIAGNVGNLPQVKTFLINYGQAAVFTPSDIPFPPNAIAAEAETNTEAVVITELDLGDLAMHRELGSVRPFHDRRPDLYAIHARTKPRVIRVA